MNRQVLGRRRGDVMRCRSKQFAPCSGRSVFRNSTPGANDSFPGDRPHRALRCTRRGGGWRRPGVKIYSSRSLLLPPFSYHCFTSFPYTLIPVPSQFYFISSNFLPSSNPIYQFSLSASFPFS